jgi:hypothetical protein
MAGGIASVSALGRVKVLGRAPTTAAPSSSATAQAFGDATSAGTASPRSALLPVHGFGIRFWVGVGGLVLLAWVYHSLPE